MIDDKDDLADTTMVILRDGCVWPVIICGSETPVPGGFDKTRPKGEDVSPAILLGRHKFVWARTRRLHTYDPTLDYLVGSTPVSENYVAHSDHDFQKYEEQRQHAFRVEAPLMEKAHYWCNYIRQASEAREVERALNARAKRNGTRAPPGKGDHNDKREKLQRRAVRQSPHAWSHPRGLHSTHVGIKQRDGSQFPPSKLRGLPHDGHNKDTARVYSDERCAILVGREKQPFVVPLCAIAGTKELERRTAWAEESETYIVCLSGDFAITAEDFEPVRDFLIDREFLPALVTANGKTQLYGHEENADQYAKCVAALYRTASLLGMGELQDLCLRKLRILISGPLSPKSLLRMTKAVMQCAYRGSDGGLAIDIQLLNTLAGMFVQMVTQEGAAFGKLLGESKGLKEEILRRVLGITSDGVKLEPEE